MRIDNLPNEILLKILKYVPRFDQVELVNKKFYDAAVKLTNTNLCIIVEPELFDAENLAVYNSIISAESRTVSRVVIVWTSQKPLNVILPIITKFSASIKLLSLHSLIPRHKVIELQNILQLIPNVEHLVLGRFRTNGPRMRPISKDFDMKKLKKLCLTDCSKNVLRVFNKLPEGVLVELECVTRHFILLQKLLQRQINIRKLKVEEKCYPFNRVRSQVQIGLRIFDHLQLESLDWSTIKQNFNVASILAKQPKLTSLRLHDAVDDTVMKSIVQLTHLESLTISVKETPVKSTRYITKLTNLKHLALEHLQNSDTAFFDTITLLNNQRITSMDLAHYTNITADQIGALSISAPKLRHLRCKYDHNTFGAVMRYFNFVEVLHFVGNVPNENVIRQDDNYLEDNNLCVNPKLDELGINFPLNAQLLNKLARDCPNVSRLSIKSNSPISSTEFEVILNGFTKLKSVAIRDGVSDLNRRNFNCWKGALRKLIFLWLIDSKPTSSRMFAKIFDVITIEGMFRPSLIMAVTTNTLISEKDKHNKM